MEKEAFTRAMLGMTDTLYRVAATQLRKRADQEGGTAAGHPPGN